MMRGEHGVPPFQAGFPEMWEEVFWRYQPFFTAAHNLTDLHNRILSAPTASQAQEAIRLIIKVMANDYGAVLVLVLNGFGVQAMKVARSLFEAECNVYYLKTTPEAVTDFINFEPITRRRLYDLMTSERQRSQDPRAVKEMHDDYAQVAPSFVKNKKRELWDSWCRDVTIFRRAQAAGLEGIYRTAYGMASSMHHYDFYAIASSMDRESGIENEVEVEPAPSRRWLGESLSTAHGSLVRSLAHYLELAQIGFEKEIEAAIGEYNVANRALIAAGG